MGILGKIFDKKECDICGNDIGLFGNRKLEDGNCCKDCAKKLSPWMTDRRQSTVENIKGHLRYREENERMLCGINPTKVIGNDTKVYIDEEKAKFFVTRSSNWRDSNPDIIDIVRVTSCHVDVKEDKKELYRQNEEGKSESYNPPRHECSYRFMAEILVDSPWFEQIQFELTDERPDSPYTQAYRDYERQADELVRLLQPDPNRSYLKSDNLTDPASKGEQTIHAPLAQDSWTCSCGAQNNSKFCGGCGAKKPENKASYRCDKCGFEPDDSTTLPRFCPQCGDPFGVGDIV